MGRGQGYNRPSKSGKRGIRMRAFEDHFGFRVLSGVGGKMRVVFEYLAQLTFSVHMPGIVLRILGPQ